MKKIKSIILFLLGFISVNAQGGQAVNNGKFMTVVLVLASILVGVFVYLFILDRKLTKIENQINNE